MNLKYYLRGLGVGILVTALIMSIAAKGKETLSNEEIKERAKALGMVEEGTLLENAQAALNTLGNPGMSDEEKPEKEQNPVEPEIPEQTSDPNEALPSENVTLDETPEHSESEASEETPQQSEEQQPAEDREPEDTQE